jgi:hypothetical protein
LIDTEPGKGLTAETDIAIPNVCAMQLTFGSTPADFDQQVPGSAGSTGLVRIRTQYGYLPADFDARRTFSEMMPSGNSAL